jgi:hypothetical protein
MVDIELARWSLIKLQMENDIRLLTDNERLNLLDMINEYITDQGWSVEEIMQEGK